MNETALAKEGTLVSQALPSAFLLTGPHTCSHHPPPLPGASSGTGLLGKEGGQVLNSEPLCCSTSSSQPAGWQPGLAPLHGPWSRASREAGWEL